jgi:FtsH-binding integral membrane protein
VIFAILGIILFGLLVILDLQKIAKNMSVDDYILGALTLYLDLIKLFGFILKPCGKKKV